MVQIMEKGRTLWWYLQRPNIWEHLAVSMLHQWLEPSGACADQAEALQWGKLHAVSVQEALAEVGLAFEDKEAVLDPQLVEEAEQRAKASPFKMGGPADLSLLYAAVRLSGARRIVETGVAYGWSSLAILAALEGRENARLFSVDMPYVKAGNEPFVGIVIPERLRTKWTLIRKPDRRGLDEAIQQAGVLDLCHYDSDKSHRGRQYGYERMWRALRPGGIFISDDIQDNLAFRNFVLEHQPRFAVTECEGKLVGIARKPGD